MLQMFRTKPMIDQATWQAAITYATGGSLFPGSQLHGEEHWRAVATQGLRLSDMCSLGADGRAMAALFGLFHDCRRQNDDWDPEHGARGAQAMLSFEPLETLAPRLRDRLADSMTRHDGGETTADALTGLGWDADRSVLTRVGIVPDFHFFSCVPDHAFDAFIEEGYRATNAPMSWDEIYAAAFART